MNQVNSSSNETLEFKGSIEGTPVKQLENTEFSDAVYLRTTDEANSLVDYTYLFAAFKMQTHKTTDDEMMWVSLAKKIEDETLSSGGVIYPKTASQMRT